MKNTKLVWRLSKLPTPEELGQLVKDKIITQEEAREVLFSSEEVEDRDKKSLKSEIKFLRELVEKLSNNNRSRVVEIIREVEVPYKKYLWYEPYDTWTYVSCGQTIPASTSFTAASNTTQATNFSDIKTF